MILTSYPSVATHQSYSSRVTAFEPSTSPHSLRCLGEMFPSHLSTERGIPHSQVPVHVSAGAHPLSFPTASVVPLVFYFQLLSLARLQQATGPFLLFALAGKTPHLGLVSETTLCSFFTNPSVVEASFPALLRAACVARPVS